MNRNSVIVSVGAILMGLAAGMPAFAWGPATQQAIVTTAMHVISKEGPVQLSKLDKDVQAGIAAPAEAVAEQFPGLGAGPIRAVESEMDLLAAVRGNAVEPYLAYRLGMLGVIVANMTAPLANDTSPYKAHYYADVDANFKQVRLVTAQRKNVDPAAYFDRIRSLAATRNDLILKDYQEGIGFNGVARAFLSEDASRSVDAVTDVWYTILTGKVAHAGVSDAQLRAYVLGAMNYYIQRHNEGEIAANYKRLSGLVTITPDLAKQIGDMLYDAGFFNRAIEEYQIVLAAEPNRKDVVEKIANYYVKVGDTAFDAKHLQQAQEAYAKAAKVDPLHPEAEGKRLKVEGMIAERDARLETIRRKIEDADKFRTQAEQLAAQHKPADAITALKQAQQLYEAVNDEFPVEYQAASQGLSNINGRLRDLKTELIQNAQNLSGSGIIFDTRKLASDTRAFDEQALQSLLTHQLTAELDKTKAQYQAPLEFK